MPSNPTRRSGSRAAHDSVDPEGVESSRSRRRPRRPLPLPFSLPLVGLSGMCAFGPGEFGDAFPGLTAVTEGFVEFVAEVYGVMSGERVEGGGNVSREVLEDDDDLVDVVFADGFGAEGVDRVVGGSCWSCIWGSFDGHGDRVRWRETTAGRRHVYAAARHRTPFRIRGTAPCSMRFERRESLGDAAPACIGWVHMEGWGPPPRKDRPALRAMDRSRTLCQGSAGRSPSRRSGNGLASPSRTRSIIPTSTSMCHTPSA